MKTKFLFLSVLIIFLSGLCFAGDLKKAPSEKTAKRMTKNTERLVNAVKYDTRDLIDIDELSFYGYHNLAFDICDRIRKMSVDEDLLKKVKIYQTVALVRIWVENGLITSINQLPEDILGIKNAKTTIVDYYIVEANEKEIEESKKELKKLLYEALTNPDTKESDIPHGVNLDNYEDFVNKAIEDFRKDIKREFRKDLPEEYAGSNYTIEKRADFTAEDLVKNHMELLAKVCTVELIDKYPLAAERLYNEYMAKYGTDMMAEIMINYFMTKGEYEKAVRLCDLSIENDANKREVPDFFSVQNIETLKALCYAKTGDLETALNIINRNIDYIKINTSYKHHTYSIYFNKILAYKYAGVEDKYKDEIENIHNELIIFSNEEPEEQKFIYRATKGYFDIFCKSGSLSHTVLTSFHYSSGTEYDERNFVILATIVDNKIN